MAEGGESVGGAGAVVDSNAGAPERSGEGRDRLLRAAQCFQIVAVGNGVRQSRLDPDDRVGRARDGASGHSHVDEVEVAHRRRG